VQKITHYDPIPCVPHRIPCRRLLPALGKTQPPIFCLLGGLPGTVRTWAQIRFDPKEPEGRPRPDPSGNAKDFPGRSSRDFGIKGTPLPQVKKSAQPLLKRVFRGGWTWDVRVKPMVYGQNGSNRQHVSRTCRYTMLVRFERVTPRCVRGDV